MNEVFLIAAVVLLISIVAVAATFLMLPDVWGWAMEYVFDRLVPPRETGLGADGIVGQTCEILRAFELDDESGEWIGAVRVRGEIWKARSSAEIPPSFPGFAQIVKIEGLVALVES